MAAIVIQEVLWRSFKIRVRRFLFRCSQIAGWRGSELLPEHGNEGTCCAVAGIERGIGDGLSCCQGLQCMDEARLLPP